MARPSKAEERKEQILDAFERCVVRTGIQGVTLEGVAKEAELPRSLVRHFVGNRDDMVEAVFERFTRRAEALWSGLSNRRPSIDEMLEFLVKEAFIGGGVGRLASELRYQRNFDENARAHFKQVFRRAQRFVEDASTDGVKYGCNILRICISMELYFPTARLSLCRNHKQEKINEHFYAFYKTPNPALPRSFYHRLCNSTEDD